MDDSKIIELFFARNEDAIKHTDDTCRTKIKIISDDLYDTAVG